MAYSKQNKRRIGLLMALMLFLSAGSLKAQSIDQLIEQLILDKQKLSELKIILKDMKDGYQVLNKGYFNIRDIVEGNFSLHKAFLDGLLAVSPPVRQYYKVAAIIGKERNLAIEIQMAHRRWVTSGLFTPAELEYLGRLYKTIGDKGAQWLDRLTMIMTENDLRMSDAERLQAIDRIYVDAAEQLARLRQFNDGVSIQALQRAREQNNLQTLKSIYGNHP